MRARILLDGKSSGYSSFMHGLFEEFLILRISRDSLPTLSWANAQETP